MRRWLRTWLAVVVALHFVVVRATSEVTPATFTVDSLADAPDAAPGDEACATAAAECTLRAAVQEAALTTLPVVIDVPAGHYVLGSALELPSGVVTMRGAARATTVLDGDDAGRIFDVLGGASLSLETLTVTKGGGEQEGGAIRAVDAALVLNDVAVTSSATGGFGGGIYAGGADLKITASLFDDDTGLAGGAIAALGGKLIVTGSTFTGNLATDVGGAIAAFGMKVFAIGVGNTFTGNVAEHSGGAVYASGAGQAASYSIAGSTFTGNQAFGGAGGAIAADGLAAPGATGGLVVVNCTFDGNAADDEGGALAAAVAIFTFNNTYSDNHAPEKPDVAVPVPFDLCRAAGICKGVAIDAFRCYRGKPSKGEPKFAPISGVRVANAFGDLLVDFKSPQLLCAPADTKGESERDAATHLEGYAVKPQKGQPKPVPPAGLALTSQIGTLVVDGAKPDVVLLPAAADPAAAPALTTSQVDRFLCSKAKLAKGQPKLAANLQLTVRDQMTDVPRRVLLKKLARLCIPTGADGGSTKHVDHLLCFQVSATKGRCAEAAPSNAGGGCKKEVDCGGTKGQTTLCAPQAKYAAVAGLHVANDLDTGRMDAAKEDVLCLPALTAP